jgi:2-oxoglutarate dehydrogenase complex dehydrogenase (E1) component-like enzyme
MFRVVLKKPVWLKRCNFHASKLQRNTSHQYIEEMETKWRENPTSVDKNWALYFSTPNRKSNSQLETDSFDLRTSTQAFVYSHQVQGHTIAGTPKIFCNI